MKHIVSSACLIGAASLGLAIRAQEASILILEPEGGQLGIAWRGPAGWNHSIQYSPVLPATVWTEVLSVTSAPEFNRQRISPLANSARGFYRIACAPPGAGLGPRLFFSDLESGPSNGGQNDLGCFITLWGEGFGTSRGDSKVMIGGQEVASYVTWGQGNGGARNLDMIVVQLGPNVRSGNIELTVEGRKSNPLPFTIRGGRIFFVSPSGNDAGSGSFQTPFRSVTKAKDELRAGDIAYLMDGVTQTEEENFSAALVISTGGEPGAPKALVAYPGAMATIGSTNLEYGLRILSDPGAIANDWVLSKLVLRGLNEAAGVGGDGSRRWRVVGNDISCPYGDGQTGCFAASLANDIAFLGNHVHGVSTAGNQPSKQYHAVYFTTDTSYVEVGWNHIRDNRTCRALQFHSSPLCLPDCGPSDQTGFNQHHLFVHDNLIHGDVCDGINLATVDPSKGPVLVYNNIIFDVGQGPPPPDGDANYAGIYVAGYTNNGQDGTGIVEVFNNTFYNCGARINLPDSAGDAGAVSRSNYSPGLMLRLRNNIIFAVAGEDYLAPNSDLSLISGSNNLWFGNGPGPQTLQNNINADPAFTDVAARNFSLRQGSPAIERGIDPGIAGVTLLDYFGLPRPQGTAPDLGPIEFQAP